MAVTIDKRFRSEAASTVAGANKRPGPFILVVGEVGHWHMSGRSLPADSQLAFADFFEISSELLETLAPDVVLSPLLCGAFDCLDLAQLLQSIGYNGRYRVLTSALPNPRLVKSEVRTTSPGVDFDFIFTPEKITARLN